jgi:hypothetical protein
MDSNRRRTLVKETLLAHIHEVPYDISVPKFDRWNGIQPVPQDPYEVQYHGDAAIVLRMVGNSDQRLVDLRRPLRIDVDLDGQIAHVFLD